MVQLDTCWQVSSAQPTLWCLQFWRRRVWLHHQGHWPPSFSTCRARESPSLKLHDHHHLPLKNGQLSPQPAHSWIKQPRPRCKFQKRKFSRFFDSLTDQSCDLARVMPLLGDCFLGWITVHQVAKYKHNFKNIKLSQQKYLSNYKKC